MWTELRVDDSLPDKERQMLQRALDQQLKSALEAKRASAVKEANNLLVVRGKHLFVWCFEEQSVHCFSLKDERTVLELQTLALTNPPLFDVESLLFSASGRYLAVLGSRGINIVELPHKWGSRNVYEAGKSAILCRCWCLDERFFVCNQKILLLDVCWHPASQDEKHIVLLTNDNCLRVYNINEPQLVDQEIRLSNCDSIGRHVFNVFASSLGETAVSFDFGLPLSKRSHTCNEDEHPLVVKRNDCLWPIYVLKGNGDVLVVYTSLENTYLSQRVMGPLTMLPPAEDNYGVDACNLMCLNCLPPLIVIATSSGMLYHCIALNNDENDPDASMLPKPTLYVYESVELTLSLTVSGDDDLLCPIRLHKDPFGPERYFCAHAAGVHAISLPIVKRFLSKRLNLENIDSTVVEHLICTKPIATSDVISVVPLGVDVTLHKGQSHIKVLLSSGDIITQRLSLWSSSRSEKQGEERTSAALLKPSVQFSDYVTEILKRNTSAPLLKSSESKSTSQEKNLQLLLSITQVFRKEYLSKMSVAAAAIDRRVKSLAVDRKVQLADLDKCETEKDTLLQQAQQLSDKYDAALERQSQLSSRCDRMLEVLQSRQTELSEAETKMVRDLRVMKTKLTDYRSQVEKVKRKFKYQRETEAEECVEFDKRGPSKIELKNITNIVDKERELIENLLQQILHLKQSNI